MFIKLQDYRSLLSIWVLSLNMFSKPVTLEEFSCVWWSEKLLNTIKMALRKHFHLISKGFVCQVNVC